MNSRILSLNIGGPSELVWGDKKISSAMKKTSVPGPLVVHDTFMEGDSFANRRFHGTPDSVVYALGFPSALKFMTLLERSNYEHGLVGENLTLDSLDESQVSVGDIFEVGEVRIQATFPRIPCAKVNYRVQHGDGMRLMQQCGRTGVYFRVLKPGKIFLSDKVRRIEKAKIPFLITEVFQLEIRSEKAWPSSEVKRAIDNGCFPRGRLQKIIDSSDGYK